MTPPPKKPVSENKSFWESWTFTIKEVAYIIGVIVIAYNFYNGFVGRLDRHDERIKVVENWQRGQIRKDSLDKAYKLEDQQTKKDLVNIMNQINQKLENEKTNTRSHSR